MANLLSNTTVGGSAVITTSNIGSYALTSIPATISPTNIYVGNAIYFNAGNNYLNWDGARINSNVGIQSTSDMRAPIFYDSNDTSYYVDPNGLSVLSHIRLNNNWANAGINQGAINIRGQYPSMVFRNTVSDSMWLRHMDASGTIQHYYASDGVDSSNWGIKHSMHGNGNFSSIGTHTASQFNGSGAGLTGTASSLSVNFATTAGALSSMNISQFSNNSGYLTGITSGQVTSALGYTPYNSSNPSGYVNNAFAGAMNQNVRTTDAPTFDYINTTMPNKSFNPFGGAKMHDAVLTNMMAGKWDRFDVTINGVLEPNAAFHLSNQNYEEYNSANLYGTDAGETKIYNINFQKLEGYFNSNGITYSSGFFDLNFYSSPFPASWSCRAKNRDGVWTNVTLTKIGSSLLRGVSPYGNWLTDIEYTLTARTGAPYVTGNITYGISEFEFFGSRIALSQGAVISAVGGYMSGVLSTKNGNSNNWNTAYSWGNHASAGYLTSLPSHNHDDRYYTESESDARYIQYGTIASSFGLNDNKLYLRTNNDNNHYIWNAADDWEEIVAYSGTGLRIASSTGVTLATFTTSGNSMNITGNAATATALTSMNISQFTNNSGYITGYTETDTLASVTSRGATTASQMSFTKTDDHAISVGTIRGRAVGVQSGEFIQLYERVNIGGPSGWGASNTSAPSYGLSVYGGATIGYGNNAGLAVTGRITVQNGNDSGTLYGPNATWGAYLYVGAASNNVASTTAQVISTDGNLHIDSGSGSKQIYMNYYSGMVTGIYGGLNMQNTYITNASYIRSNTNIYTDQNYGYGLVGLYNSTRYQGVFAMGDSYKLAADGTGTGTLYGIAWTHTNVGGQSKSGLGHQALFMDNGVTQTAIGSGIWTNGLITSIGYGTSANWNTAYGWGNHASAGYLLTSGKAADSELLDGIDSTRVIFGENSTGTTYITDTTLNGALKSGFYTVGSGGIPNATSVNFVLHTAYYGIGNLAGFDLACNDSTTSQFYLRPATGGGKGAWQTIITSSSIGSQSVSYASTAGSAPNGGNVNSNYDVAVGVGNGLRFWGGSDSYKVSMGVGSLYQYGPVTDYSIKMQMNDSSTDRGFTWGRISYAPIAALNSTSGDLQIAGSLRAAGHLFTSYNGNNILLKTADAGGDAGILVQNSSGSFKFQIYGNGTDYGFLNGNWAAWDIRKTKNGALYMNDNNSYYLQTNSTSNFVALNIQGNAVVHAGNIGSQSVSNANTVGGYAAAQTYTATGNAAGSYLGGHYSSGGTETPNSATFGAGKLKLAMLSGGNLGFGGSWNDVLWLSGYNGGDVKSSHALVFDKYSTNVWVSDQNFDSATWGTGYLLLSTANYNSYSPTLTGTGASGTWGISVTGSAGSVAWTNVSSRPTALSQFTNDLGNYGGWITSSGSISGNAATATSATYLNSSNYIAQRGSNGSWNADFTSTPAGTMSYAGDLGANTTNGPGGTWWMQQNFRHTNASNYWGTQVAWGWEDNANRLATRNITGGNYGAWVYYLNSSNFTTYAPSLTGSGASGTWGISVTGSAGSVAWTNVSSRPTALSQFSNDLGNYGGFLTSLPAHDHDRVFLTDSRGASRAPSYYDQRYAQWDFQNNGDTGAGGDSWHGLLTVAKWFSYDASHRQEQLAFTGDDLKRRTATSDSAWGSWKTIIDTGNVGSQSVNYANSAGSATTAGSATIASQLNKYGDIYGQDWNSYYVQDKLIAAAVYGHSGANRPNLTYDYGVALSYGEATGPRMQMYFPENSPNLGTIFRKATYRTGWNGAWSTWKTLVEQEGNTCTIVGGVGAGLEVHGNPGYNQDPLTYFLLRGAADTSWKALKVRLTGDAGGQDIEFRRIAENGADSRMWYVPRGGNTVNFDYPIVQPSDSRLKDNITPISTPVDKIKSLRGVEFDWNSGEQVGTHDVGLIAQDVEAVLPEAVTTQEDGYKNLAYTKVIPLLVEAMKEQQAMIEALKAEIELLKNK